MAQAGIAYVQVRGDLSHLNKQLIANLSPARLGKLGKLAGVGLGAGVAAGFAGKALFDVGKQFDTALDQIRTSTGKTGKSLAGLKGDFKNVVGSVPTDFASAGAAVAGLSQRLEITGKPLQRLSKQILQLSKITKTDVGENVAAVTRLFGDWSVKTKNQASQLDKLFRVSQHTGISVGDLSRFMVAFGSPLRQLGFSFDEAAVMFGKFEKEGVNLQTIMPGFRFALKNLSAPTKEAADIFDKLGINIKKGPAVALREVFAAIKKAPTDLKANAIAFAVFGKRAGPDMAAAVREGRFEYRDLLKQMRDGHDTIDKAEKDTRDFAENWQLLKNKVFVAIEPLATKFFKTIGEGMGTLATADFSKIGADLDKTFQFGKIDFGPAGQDISASLDSIKSIVNSKLAKLLGSDLLGTLKKQVAGIAQIFRGMANVIGGTLKLIDDLIHLRLGKAFGDLGQIFHGGIQLAVGSLRLMTAPVREIMARVGRALLAPMRSAWQSIKGISSDASGAVVGAVHRMGNAFGAVGGRLRSIASGPFKAIKDVIKAIIEVLGKIVGVARRAADAISSIHLPKIPNPLDLVPGVHARGGIVKKSLAVVGEEGPELVSLPIGSRVHSHPESVRMAQRMGVPGFAKGGYVDRFYKPRKGATVFKHRKPSLAEQRRGDRIAAEQERKRQEEEQRLYKPRTDAPVFKHRVPSKAAKERADKIARQQERQRVRKRKRQEHRADLRLRTGLGGITPYQRKHGESEFDTVRKGLPDKLFGLISPKSALGQALGTFMVGEVGPTGKALETYQRHGVMLNQAIRKADETGRWPKSLKNPAGRTGRTEALRKALPSLDDAFEGARLKAATVYRGVDMRALGAESAKELAGKVHIEPGYTSASDKTWTANLFAQFKGGSMLAEDAGRKPAVLRIRVPEGTRGIRPTSAGFGSKEAETLFPRGARLKFGKQLGYVGKGQARAPLVDAEIFVPKARARKQKAGGPSSDKKPVGDSAAFVPAVRYLVGLMREKFGLSVSSGLRPGDTGSFHSVGKAADFVGPKMHEAAAYVKSSGLYRTLLEGIHNPNLSTDSGRLVSPGFWQPGIWELHKDHVHLAASTIAKSFKADAPTKKGPKRISGGKLALGQLVTLAKKVGFPDPALAAAVAYAESSGKVAAVGDSGESFGPWQIHWPDHQQYDKNRLEHDAFYNARAALAISKHGKSFQPWTQYRTGAYKSFLGGRAMPLPKGTSSGTPTGSSFSDYLTMKLDLATGEKESLRWINRGLRYWRGVQRRNKQMGNWSRVSDAHGHIVDLTTQKKTLRDKDAPDLTALGSLAPTIGKGPSAFKTAPIAKTLDQINLDIAKAALTETYDAEGNITPASFADDIAAASKAVSIWDGLWKLVQGTKIGKHFIVGTLAQQTEAATNLKQAKDSLKSVQDDAKSETGSSPSAPADNGIADLLRQDLEDALKNLAVSQAQFPVFQRLQKFHEGGVVKGPVGAEVPVLAKGGEVIGHAGKPGSGDVHLLFEEGAISNDGIDESKVRTLSRDEFTQMMRGIRPGGLAPGRTWKVPR